MRHLGWRQPLVAALAAMVMMGTAASAMPAENADPAASHPSTGRLADAAVVAQRVDSDSSQPMPSAPRYELPAGLVFQPQSDWGLRLAGDDSVASLDAAVELDQPVKLHTPLAQRGRSELDLLPGEPAHEILELMESSGGSVLDGTLFNSLADPSDEQERRLRRSTIVQTIRQLQEEDAHRAAAPAAGSGEALATWTTRGTPSAMPSVAMPSAGVSVEEMRRVCDQLDRAASDLERQELYHFADRLRQTAQEMRLEARRLAAGQPSQAPGRMTVRPIEESSAEAELRMLRRELHELRNQLEARPGAATVSYPRYGLELEPAAAEMPALFPGPADE